MATDRKTIRFEDLGEPIQNLIKSLKGGVSEADMALLEFVSVKDMAKIYGELSEDRQAEQIWEELRNALEARQKKAEMKRMEMEGRVEELEAARKQAEEDARRAQEEEEERAAAEAEAEAKRKKKIEKRRRKAEEAALAAEAEEAAELERQAQEEEERIAAEEEERLAEEEAARAKREKKKKKREAKLRELEAEQAALQEERSNAKKDKKKNQKDEWRDYVDNHPLEFAEVQEEIQQVKVERVSKAPPSATEELLNRSYTPKCPNCAAKFSKPPPEWDCPMCLRRLRKRFKVWQPDDDSDKCMMCKVGIGRFSRHHCRNCGRLTCGTCLTGKALITHLGYKDSPVKVCGDCVGNIPEEERAAATGDKSPEGKVSPRPE